MELHGQRATTDEKQTRKRYGWRSVLGAASLVVAAVAVAVAAPATARAATLDGIATTASPGTTSYLASGGSETEFTVSLPAQAACSGDTETDGYHVFSYLVEPGTTIAGASGITFPSNLPNTAEGQYGLVEADGAYWGDKNTAPSTGQIINIPNDFEFGPLVSADGVALDTLLYQDSHTSGVWEGGFACTNTSGTVTDYWNTEVTFTASGSDPNGFTWSAIPGPSGSQVPDITSTDATTFTEGTHGSFTPIATGNPTPTITEQGTLPGGVTFTGGVLSGTATQSGTFHITFTATNGIGNPDVQDFTLTVEPPTLTPTSTTTTPASSSITLGSSNTDGAIVTGTAAHGSPTGTVTFYECGPTTTPTACTSKANEVGTGAVTLAPGANNTSTASSVSFTPNAAGDWCFAGYYSGDSNYAASSDTSVDECFDVTQTSCNKITITSTSLPEGTVGQPYSFALTACGGTPPYTWNKYGPVGMGVLPPRVGLSRSGIISGIPKRAGTYTIVVKCLDVSHSHKTQATQKLTLVINPPDETPIIRLGPQIQGFSAVW